MKAAGLEISKQMPQYYLLSLDNTLIFSFMCCIILFDKSKCKNLPDDFCPCQIILFSF